MTWESCGQRSLILISFLRYRPRLAHLYRCCAQLQPRRASQSLQVHGNPTYTSIDTSTATVNTESTAGTQSADAAVLFDGSAPTSDWATRMSTPNRYRVLSSDDDRAGHDEPFVPVVSRRARRQRQHPSPAAAATNTRVRSSPPAAAQRQDMPQRRTFMYGKSSAAGSGVGTMGTGGYIVPPSSGLVPRVPSKSKMRLMSKF